MTVSLETTLLKFGLRLILPLLKLFVKECVLKQFPKKPVFEKVRNCLKNEVTDLVKLAQFEKYEGIIQCYQKALDEIDNEGNVTEDGKKYLFEVITQSGGPMMANGAGSDSRQTRLKLWEIHLHSVASYNNQNPQKWLNEWNRLLEHLFRKHQINDDMMLAQYFFDSEEIAAGSGKAQKLRRLVGPNDSELIEAVTNFRRQVCVTVLLHLSRVPLKPQELPFIMSWIPQAVRDEMPSFVSDQFFANFAIPYLPLFPNMETYKYRQVVRPDLIVALHVAEGKLAIFRGSEDNKPQLLDLPGTNAKSLAYDELNKFLITADEQTGQTLLQRWEIVENKQSTNIDLIRKEGPEHTKTIWLTGAKVFCTPSAKVLLISMLTKINIQQFDSYKNVLENKPLRAIGKHAGYDTRDQWGPLGVMEWGGAGFIALVKDVDKNEPLLHLVPRDTDEYYRIRLPGRGPCALMVRQKEAGRYFSVIWEDAKKKKYFGFFEMDQDNDKSNKGKLLLGAPL